MSKGKKTLNVFGIIVAWLLSLVLVVMLIVSPLVMSVLSLLKPETITKVITETLTSTINEALNNAPQANSYEVKKLSSTTTTGQAANSDMAAAISEALEDMFGQSVDQKAMDKILGSKAVKEVMETYTDSVVSEFTGGKSKEFNSETLKKILNDNLDEIVDIVTEISPDANINVEELKNQIETAINSQDMDKVVEMLPDPKELKQEMMESSPELEMALGILAMKNTIIAVLIGIIVLLSGLIFVCRLFGFRGFRWLATDLFIGAGFGILFSIAFSASNTVLTMLGDMEPTVKALAEGLLSAFATSMWIHTAVMLVAGVGLLIAYIFIKKARAKKAVVTEAEEEVVLQDMAEEVVE